VPACRACSAPIRFAVHASTGKSRPVNAESSTDGDVVLFHEGGVLKCRDVSLPADYSRPRHKSHLPTCPKAEQFRRSGK
jgi:hypothetical protein